MPRHPGKKTPKPRNEAEKRFLKKKIRKNKREGRKDDQAVAVAFSQLQKMRRKKGAKD